MNCTRSRAKCDLVAIRAGTAVPSQWKKPWVLSPKAACESGDGDEDEEDDEVDMEGCGAAIVDALGELTAAVRVMPSEIARVLREEKSRKRKEKLEYNSRGVGTSP
jgi:hypothetical protein